MKRHIANVRLDRQEEDAALPPVRSEPLLALVEIARISHAGGLDGLTEWDALNEIRRLSMPWWDHDATSRLQANSVLCVNDRMTACEECGEEWPAGDHERWRLVNGQRVCAKCAKEAEPKREADVPTVPPGFPGNLLREADAPKEQK